MRKGGCKMTLVCQGVVSQLQNQLQNGVMAATLGFWKLWGFRKAFGNCEMRLEAAKWHSCGNGVFHRGGHGAAKSFRSQWAFSQPSLDFAVGFLGLRKYFVAKGHFRKGLLWAAKSRRPWFFSCSWASFDSKRPSFLFLAIPPKLDHSKRLSYI